MDRFKKEPAVLIGLVITILTAVAQELTDSDLDWSTVVPLVGGILIRFFVSPVVKES